MKNYLASILLFTSLLGLTAPASAVIVTGSSYSFFIKGSVSGNDFEADTVFDGIPATGLRGDQLITVSEFETPISGMSSQISTTLSSTTELFPIYNETAILGIGSSDPLNIDPSISVSLDLVRVTLRDILGNTLFVLDDISFLSANPVPWDGTFPAPNGAFGVDSVGGMGVTSVTFDFFVTQIPADVSVPEPGSVLLCGLGLLAIVLLRRRRRD